MELEGVGIVIMLISDFMWNMQLEAVCSQLESWLIIWWQYFRASTTLLRLSLYQYVITAINKNNPGTNPQSAGTVNIT